MSKKIIIILVIVLVIGAGMYFYSTKQISLNNIKTQVPVSSAPEVQNVPVATQESTCANNPNGYGVIFSSNSTENSDVEFNAGDKNVNLGTFSIEACSDLDGGIVILGDSKNAFSTNINNFKNIIFTVDGNQVSKKQIIGKNFNIYNFRMLKGQKENFVITADIVSAPTAMSSNVGVSGTFGVVVSENKQAGTATSNITNDAGLNLRHVTINSLITTSQCSGNTKDVIFTKPEPGAISPLGVGDVINLSWLPCNLPTNVSYKVIISNPALTTPDQEDILWSGAATSANITLKGPIDEDLNVITVSAMQGSTEIQIKGDKDTLMFKKK